MPRNARWSSTAVLVVLTTMLAALFRALREPVVPPMPSRPVLLHQKLAKLSS